MEEQHVIAGMLNLINEANAALATDGEFAADVLAVCQQWFTDNQIQYQYVNGQYVLAHTQAQEQEQ